MYSKYVFIVSYPQAVKVMLPSQLQPQPGVHQPQPGVHQPQPGVHQPQPGVYQLENNHINPVRVANDGMLTIINIIIIHS